MNISVILAAGGIGARLGQGAPKQFRQLNGKAVALYSYELFCTFKEISEIIVVCDSAYQHLFPSSVIFAIPGKERSDSIWNGLEKVSPDADYVCIHDAARPFLKREDLEALIQQAVEHKAATLAVPVKYTIKQSDHKGFVEKTLDRSFLWDIQTPQIMAPDLLREGFRIAREKNISVTDDASLVELTGHRVKLVKGSYQNFKITTPEDWHSAQIQVNHCL